MRVGVLGVEARRRRRLQLLLRLQPEPVNHGVREASGTGRVLVTMAILGGGGRADPVGSRQ